KEVQNPRKRLLASAGGSVQQLELTHGDRSKPDIRRRARSAHAGAPRAPVEFWRSIALLKRGHSDDHFAASQPDPKSGGCSSGEQRHDSNFSNSNQSNSCSLMRDRHRFGISKG